MNNPTSPEEDETKKKEPIPADAHPEDRDLAASNIDPIRSARNNASAKGYLFGQILRGIASGTVRGLVDDFLDGD